MSVSSTVRTMAQECVAARLRLVTRAVTGLYDAALRPHGLRITQTSILVAVAYKGPARPSEVCRWLQLDKSTLSRDVERLLARGWLETVPTEDGRSHLLRVTATGVALLERIEPAWRQAQGRAEELLGRAGVAAVGRMAETLWAAGGARPEG